MKSEKQRLHLERFKNKHLLDEQKIKISIANKGKKRTDEFKKRMSLLKKGIIPSLETRIKMSIARKGKPATWLIGKKLSVETRDKISKAGLGRIGYWKGKKFSKEHSSKCGNALRGKKLPEYRKIQNSICQIGEKNHNWKGGITDLRDKIRNSFKYRQWRSDVFTRDNFTCQWCCQRGNKLNADHIKPFSLLLQEYEITNFEQAVNCDELWNINNGRTLCLECHKKTETYLLSRKSYQLDLL